jgi:acyl carrier protein
MERKEIFNKVVECIARIKDIPETSELLQDENAEFGPDLHIWSGAGMELITTLEHELDIRIPDPHPMYHRTIGEFVDLIAEGKPINTPHQEPAKANEGDSMDFPFDVKRLRRNRCKDKSFYVVKFEIDQRDADYITVSTSPIDGFPSKKTLAKLCVMAHYRDLERYDGAWWGMGGIREALESYIDGSFYDACNRFKIEGISIWGYDANTKSFYDMDLPEPSQLGMSLDEAYESLFSCEE